MLNIDKKYIKHIDEKQHKSKNLQKNTKVPGAMTLSDVGNSEVFTATSRVQ